MTALILCVRTAVPSRVAGFAMAVVGFLAWGALMLGAGLVLLRRPRTPDRSSD